MPGKAKMKQAPDSQPPGPLADNIQQLRDELATAKTTIATLQSTVVAATNKLQEMNVTDRTRSVELALEYYSGKDSVDSSQLIGTATDIYNYIRS